MEYGLCWSEWNRQDQMVCKTKMFKTAAQREAYVKKLQAKNNFDHLVARSNPKEVR